LVDGQAFDLKAWRAQHPGQAQLLYFWAEWCAICKTTAGNVSNISADWPVTSIATESGSAEQVAEFMRKSGYRWSTLPDPAKAEILRQYGLPGTPAFIIINPAGECPLRFSRLYQRTRAAPAFVVGEQGKRLKLRHALLLALALSPIGNAFALPQHSPVPGGVAVDRPRPGQPANADRPLGRASRWPLLRKTGAGSHCSAFRSTPCPARWKSAFFSGRP
jgi:thiol-disulfide isomerase/thioredoxin